jgi:gluconolactonase
MKASILVVVALLVFGLSADGLAQQGTRYVKPDAIVDLRTEEGVKLVRGQWRYAGAKIVEVSHRQPGPDLKATGEQNRTNDIVPRAGAADFDDSAWEAIPATSLEKRRSTGKLCFNWYRIHVKLPERVGNFDVAGSVVSFETVVDDYAEVWVNGRLRQVLGQGGGGPVAGWNAPNRVVVTRDARPGQEIQLAVFAANAPLSAPPDNFIWVRSATLDFHSPEHARLGRDVATEIVRDDPAIDKLIPPGTKIEQIADGFGFTEGPVWVDGVACDEGHLLFSDPNNNTIYRWSALDGQVSVYRTKSGYTGTDIGEYGQPGSNGLALDAEGRLTINEHGNRRVTRLEKNGVLTVLADRYEGERLNSPNDLVYRSDGTLYFTDPPFGLPKFHDDPQKELQFSGVFCLREGKLRVVSTDLSGPNGLAFSPDEKYLYVTNWDVKKKVVMRYEVANDGGLSAGRVFFDASGAPGEEALDGLKVDRRGNLYFSGPGGVWIVSPEAKRVGLIKAPQLPANLAWGDADRHTLYMTARAGLYRIRLNSAGSLAGRAPSPTAEAK